MDYVYHEYPKCLYNQDGQTLTVDNQEEEVNAAAMGWMTAEKFHASPAPVDPVPSAPATPPTSQASDEPKSEDPEVSNDGSGSTDQSV
jgi:hypothetical protein